MADPDTKNRFSSFAAPTAEDRAAFDALSPEEQAAIMEAEIAKGFDGQPVTVTEDTSNEIMSRVLKRAASTNANR